MNCSKWIVKSPVAACIALFMAMSLSNGTMACAQQSSIAKSGPAAGTQTQALVDAPQPASASAGSPAQTGALGSASNAPEPAPGKQQNSSSKPLGTAAAPYEPGAGVMASRPAGAVIAPAKQRRVHILAIRIALIVAGGVAIGTVMALTHGTPSVWK